MFELPDTGRVPMPPDAVGSKARRGGWKVGRNESRDRCPAHIHNRGHIEMAANGRNHGGAGRTIGEIYEDKPPVPPGTRQVFDTHTVAKDGLVTLRADRPLDLPAGTPFVERTMDREEKRILFGELDAAYQDAEHGYKPGHTDKTVADALGVPVVWVRQLREEMFGPAEGDKTLKEMAALLERQIALETSINDAKETFAALLKEAHSISIRLTDLKSKKG